MAFDLSASQLEELLPFYDTAEQNDIVAAMLSSVDFSTVPIDKASVRALSLAYGSNTNDIESTSQSNVGILTQLFERVTYSLGEGVINDIIKLPLTALVSIKAHEKVLYTRAPLSGTYADACRMATVLDRASSVELRPTRQSVVALILQRLYANKLLESRLFKPYSALSSIRQFCVLAEAALRDDFGSLLAQVDSLYEYALKYKHVLYEKKKRLTNVSEYGFEDSSKWDEERIRFATDLVRNELRQDTRDTAMEATMTHFCAEFIVDSVVQDADSSADPVRTDSNAITSNTCKGTEFERHCITLLSENGWNSSPTAKTGDKGVDIIAAKRGLRIAIQCKHWETSVGSSAVQEVYTGSKFYEADAAVIISQTPLTSQANEIAHKLRVVVATSADIPTLEALIIKSLIQ